MTKRKDLPLFIKAYPNLSAAQIGALVSARVAVEYRNCTLSKVRTLALAPIALVPDPALTLETHASKIMEGIDFDSMTYGFLNSPTTDVPDIPTMPLKGLTIQNPQWVTCTAIGYHSDTTRCDTDAYVFWCLKSSAPMTFMLGGNAYPMRDGELYVFDARVPHALVSQDPKATMVAILASAPLTPELYSQMGIFYRKSSPDSYLRMQTLKHMDIDEITGDFCLGSC